MRQSCRSSILWLSAVTTGAQFNHRRPSVTDVKAGAQRDRLASPTSATRWVGIVREKRGSRFSKSMRHADFNVDNSTSPCWLVKSIRLSVPLACDTPEMR